MGDVLKCIHAKQYKQSPVTLIMDAGPQVPHLWQTQSNRYAYMCNVYLCIYLCMYIYTYVYVFGPMKSLPSSTACKYRYAYMYKVYFCMHLYMYISIHIHVRGYEITTQLHCMYT
jgi:hypothetical protein